MLNEDIGKVFISYGAVIAGAAMIEDAAYNKHMSTNERFYQFGISMGLICIAIAILPINAIKKGLST